MKLFEKKKMEEGIKIFGRKTAKKSIQTRVQDVAVEERNDKVKSESVDIEKKNSAQTKLPKRFVDDKKIENIPGVAPWIIESCKKLGIVRPTPIQWNLIPQVLQGKNVIGCAEVTRIFPSFFFPSFSHLFPIF